MLKSVPKRRRMLYTRDMKTWKATPASAKDLKNKGILNRHELISESGERLGLVLESGGAFADSNPVASVMLPNGRLQTQSFPTMADAKAWAEATA